MADNTGDYITLQQVRDAGITAGDADDATVLAAIKIWMEFIDQQTGQFFNKRSGTYTFEGRNTDVVFFGAPIIDITAIRMNRESVGTPLDNFMIFNSRDFPDNRRNPKLKIVSKRRNIFTGTSSFKTFHRGTTSEIDGSWGFLEPDGTTPALVQRAVLKLVIKAIRNPLDSTTTTSNQGPLKREKTDLHETEYFEPGKSAVEQGDSSSGDVEVDKIIAMYRRAPIIGGSILDVTTTEEPVQFDTENHGDF